MEMLDNSLQHGKASVVAIAIDNSRGIAVVDDGIGIDDINRIFTLGDASAYGDLGQIGQYGVGATDAMIFLGRKSEVRTIRNGRLHEMHVDWIDVEKTNVWPTRYKGKGSPAEIGEMGTEVTIKGLFTHYFLRTSEALAKDLGLTFAPALLDGTKIKLHHRLASGENKSIEIAPYTPDGLKDVIAIKGEIKTSDGSLRWSGRAGLAINLLERHNGAHIAFQHRVIEMTRDPFKGTSAPTLYVEVRLDATTPWKFCLSDHKDGVVRYREELINSIHSEIEALLDKAREQATNLALIEMTALIEGPINKALKGAGLLCSDENSQSEEDGPCHFSSSETDEKTFAAAKEGASEGSPSSPTGVEIRYIDKKRMEGRAFAWDIEGKRLILRLERERFSKVCDWPPNLRNMHVAHLLISFICHAVDDMFWHDADSLARAVNKKLFREISEWSEQPQSIAPLLYSRLIEQIALQ